jgi:hypothetical protein
MLAESFTVGLRHMKQILLICAVVALVGCGKKEPVAEVKPLEEKQQEVKEKAKPDEAVAETKPPEVVSVSLNLKHEIKGDTVTITGCDKKASGALTIPATIEGKAVTSIGKSAFSRCSRLTSITIPDSVTSIGEYAFYTCLSLTRVTIGDSVTSIGMRSFLSCSRLTTIEVGARNVSYTDVNGTLFNSEKTVLLTYPAGKKGANYNIPNSVTSIGQDAFYDCRGLTSITIGPGVTAIGKEAFHGCSRLVSIMIPDSVTSIGDYAFVHCTSLRSITIPAAVTVIRNGVFDNCTSLTRLIFLGVAPEDKTGLINTFPTIYRKPEAKGWDGRWSGRPVKLISEKP